jgi:AcrR family transcriptional regulator
LAAAEVIAAKGYAGASVEEIALVARVAKGSVFYNFGSKDRLLEELLAFGFHEMVARLRSAAQAATGPAGLPGLAWCLLENISRYPAVAKVLASQVLSVEGEWRSSLGPLRREALGLFAVAIEQGATLEMDDAAELALLDGLAPGADGEVSEEEAERRAGIVFGAILAAALTWMAFEPATPLADIHRSVMACVGAALTP